MALVVDVDSHVYEPEALWEEYIPPAERERAKWAFHHSFTDDGQSTTILNGKRAKELNKTPLVRQAIWRPGMTVEDIGRLDAMAFRALNPGAWNAPARLSDMDAMGVDKAVLFPTLFAEYLPQVTDTDAGVSLARAYNDWLWDLCEQGGGRLHPVGILPMGAPDLAVAELERIHAKGFRSVMLRPAFYKLDEALESHGRSVAATALGQGVPPPPVFVEDQPFRPIWARAEQLGIVVCVHPSVGITGPDAVSSGGFAERVSARLVDGFTVAEPIAYMQDAELFLTAALFHGLLEDLPALRLAILHGGVTWVPLAIEKAETYLWLQPQGADPVCLEPEEIWEKHPVIVSFDSWEKPLSRMPDLLGSKASWGSRYPHHDAASPEEARRMLNEHEIDEHTIERFLGTNAADLFQLDVN
jgi:predicted TIM-barrel fold metal-dependent hydrolase